MLHNKSSRSKIYLTPKPMLEILTEKQLFRAMRVLSLLACKACCLFNDLTWWVSRRVIENQDYSFLRVSEKQFSVPESRKVLTVCR